MRKERSDHISWKEDFLSYGVSIYIPIKSNCFFNIYVKAKNELLSRHMMWLNQQASN